MLNVKFVIFPCLKGFIEAPVTLNCVIQEDGAPAQHTHVKSIYSLNHFSVNLYSLSLETLNINIDKYTHM